MDRGKPLFHDGACRWAFAGSHDPGVGEWGLPGQLFLQVGVCLFALGERVGVEVGTATVFKKVYRFGDTVVVELLQLQEGAFPVGEGRYHDEIFAFGDAVVDFIGEGGRGEGGLVGFGGCGKRS